MSSLVLCLGLLCGDQPAPAPEADQAEEQPPAVTTHEQAAQAEARALEALARGKREKAVSERRQVVQFHEAQLKRAIERSARVCDGRVEDAAGELAAARARLADAEGDLRALAALLPRVLLHHERTLQTYQRLLECRAVSPDEALDMQRQAREEMRRAQQRLAEVKRQLQSP
jgi:hypothetical protein